MYQSGIGYKSTNLEKYLKNKKIKEYSCIQKDETAIKAGSELIWLWVVIEPKHKEILCISYIKRAKYVCSRTISV